MTAEAKAGTTSIVKYTLLAIRDEGFSRVIREVSCKTLPDGSLYITAFADPYDVDLVGEFADLQEEVRSRSGGDVLALMPKSCMDPLRPGEFRFRFGSPESINAFLSVDKLNSF